MELAKGYTKLARSLLLYSSGPACGMLAIISVMSAKVHWAFFLSYLPTILVILYGWKRALQNRPGTRYAIIADLIAIFAVAGATFNQIFPEYIGRTNQSNPVEISLMVWLAVCSRPLRQGLTRNLLIISCSLAFSLILLNDFNQVLVMQYVVGSCGGMLLWYVSHTAAKYYILFKTSDEKQIAEQSRAIEFLHKELKRRMFRHQLEMMMDGAAYQETMPTEERTFFVSKFDIVGSSKFVHYQKTEMFHRVFGLCEKSLQKNYESHIPRRDVGGYFEGVETNREFKVTADGYFIKTVGDGYFASYGYPFSHQGNVMTPAKILALLLNQFLIFEKELRDAYKGTGISACQSITFGTGRGIFSGSLANYEIEGQVMTEAARYEEARSEAELRAVNMKLKSGFYAVAASEEVIQEFLKHGGGAIVEKFKKYKLSKPIEDVSSPHHIYYYFIEWGRIEEEIWDIERSSGDARNVIPMSIKKD